MLSKQCLHQHQVIIKKMTGSYSKTSCCRETCPWRRDAKDFITAGLCKVSSGTVNAMDTCNLSGIQRSFKLPGKKMPRTKSCPEMTGPTAQVQYHKSDTVSLLCVSRYHLDTGMYPGIPWIPACIQVSLGYRGDARPASRCRAAACCAGETCGGLMKKFVHSLIFTVSTPTPTSNPHLQPNSLHNKVSMPSFITGYHSLIAP